MKNIEEEEHPPPRAALETSGEGANSPASLYRGSSHAPAGVRWVPEPKGVSKDPEPTQAALGRDVVWDHETTKGIYIVCVFCSSVLTPLAFT